MSTNGKPTTIARVITRLNVGGPAQQAILMTEAFRRKGYRALLLTGEVAPGEGEMEYLAAERHIRPVRIAALSRRISYAKDLQAVWRLVKFFRRERPLVVHTHTAKAGAVGRVAAMLARVPVRVHTFHGHVFRGYFSAARTWMFVAIERLLALQTDCIVTVSESQRKELVETYRIAPASKVVSIELGFDLQPFLPIPVGKAGERVPLGDGEDSPLVGWIGRMTAIKAPGLFLDAAARIHSALPSARFVMVGDGELRRECEERILGSGLHGNLRVTGWRRDLQRVYCDLDLVLLTSINEGTPLVLLEAMASARPFVATDVGGVRDLMAGRARKEEGWERFDNGILVPRDAGLIANAARRVLSSPELRGEMGRAGREFVRTRYSHERLAAELEILYGQLARKKSCALTTETQMAASAATDSLTARTRPSPVRASSTVQEQSEPTQPFLS